MSTPPGRVIEDIRRPFARPRDGELVRRSDKYDLSTTVEVDRYVAN